MLTKVLKVSTLLAFLFISSNACKKQTDKNPCGITDISLFGIEKDKKLGAQVDSSITNSPSEYPLLSQSKYPLVYQELNAIRDNILNSGKIKHKADFAWSIKVIKDDNTLNAFCTPGGYIYVYTGIIKYLPTLDALAGVMGHEMAHADERHSTKTMTREYGLSFLLSIIGGDSSKLIQVAKNLKSLQYSRCHESEADANSVDYLANASNPYQCDATARFFELIEADGGAKTPEFLSTHPSPENRVQAITSKAKSINCNLTPQDPTGTKIKAIKESLVY